MSKALLTAITDRFEGRVVRALDLATDLDVVRRCADLADLLAAAAMHLGEVALVSADLRGLDRSAVEQLHGHALLVLGIYPPGDEQGERRLRQLGVDAVASADASGAELESLVRGVADPGGGAKAGPLTDGLDLPLGTGRDGGPEDAPPVLGVVVAVWGPTGAPGRTTLAINLAGELAGLGRRTLLVDADTYGGCVAQTLSLLDEAPGLAAAARAADQGNLDLVALARLAPEVSAGLRVLTGIPRAERWPELRAAALEHVLALSRRLAEVVVVDCGFNLEDDEELSYDTLAPRRNAATLTVLDAADQVVAVGAGDPIGLQRLVRGLQELGTTPAAPPLVVVNKVRASAAGARPEERIGEALQRFAGVDRPVFVPDDRESLDVALLAGRTLAEVASSSPARVAIRRLAASLVGEADPAPARRRLRRR
ncbi:MAG TPA: hypothetical protein VFJ97_06120 [Dermatophilaceae bacterium]|nr:hypothetical protein [Dermatophilaceae bacterium]